MMSRAAQFAPFAALTGHDAAITEAGRLTDVRLILNEDEVEALDKKMNQLLSQINLHPRVTLTYFAEDERKEGGQYLSAEGCVTKYDEYQHLLWLEDGTVIDQQSIIDVIIPGGEST